MTKEMIMRPILLASLLLIATISLLAQPAVVKPADKAVAPAAVADVAADGAKARAELAAQIADLEVKLADARAKMNVIDAEAKGKVVPINQAKIMPSLPYTNPENTILKATDHGLFIIGSGVIAKYDIKTLAPLGNLRLVDIPVPNYMMYRKKDPAGMAADKPVDWVKNNRDNQLIMAKPVVIEDGKDLIIILNDKFLRVGMDKVNLIASADMTVKKDAAGVTTTAAATGNNGGEVPTVQLVDNTLYVMSGGNLWSLNAADGKELGQSKIPIDPNNKINKYLGGGIGGPIMMNFDALGAM